MNWKKHIAAASLAIITAAIPALSQTDLAAADHIVVYDLAVSQLPYTPSRIEDSNAVVAIAKLVESSPEEFRKAENSATGDTRFIFKHGEAILAIYSIGPEFLKQWGTTLRSNETGMIKRISRKLEKEIRTGIGQTNRIYEGNGG